MTYLTGALYVHPLWFYKHQHESRVRSKLFVACQHVSFSLSFAAILVNCAPGGEMHNYCTPRIIKENFENFLIHRCNYILLSEVYCVWKVVKSPTIILNNPLFTWNFHYSHIGALVKLIGLKLYTIGPTLGQFHFNSKNIWFCYMKKRKILNFSNSGYIGHV